MDEERTQQPAPLGEDDPYDPFADVAELLDEPPQQTAPPTDADAPPSDVQTTEWFNVDEYLAFDDGPPPLPRREHHVTAVVVGHDGAVWLPAVLTTLSAQTRLPDVAVGVDAGSVDQTAAMLTDSFGADHVVTVPDGSGFGAAVSAGLDHVGREPFPGAAVEWVWFLHDDSAPSPTCLEKLLDAADDNPSAAILGPKILGWHDRRLLLEAGVTITGSGRRVTGLERREHDQGQHDGTRDVLSVSSAGMLVRRDVWDALEGFDPDLPLFRDDLDLCWRAHRRGERVLVATDAVLHHREASAHGRRADDIAPRPHRADRQAAVHVLLAHASAVAAPFVALRLFLGSLLRAGTYLLGKDVAAARDEVGAVTALALHPGRIRRSHELVLRTTTEPARVVRSLRPSAASQARQGLEALAGVLTTSGAVAPSTAVSALDSGPVGDDADFMDGGSTGLTRRLLGRPSVFMGIVLTVLAVIGTRGLWFGDGVLQGGALLPAPQGASDLWSTFTQAWHDVGPGSSTPSSPYLVVVAALATLLLGKAPVAVSVALLLAMPLAGWAAYLSLRGLIASRPVRVWAGAAYALLPAMTGAMASGRIGTTIAAVVLPFALRSLVRICGPRGTMRRAAGSALLVAVVLATAPALWLVLLVAGLAGALYLVRREEAQPRAMLGRLSIGLLAPLVLLLPWSWHLLTNPALLLLEPGLSTAAITDPELTGWDVLLLHPGGPGMTPLWITIGIVLAGVLSLLRSDRRRTIGGLAVLAGLALAMGLIQLMVLVTPPGTSTEVRPWPGQATLLLGGVLIAMAAAAADGLRDRFVGSSFTFGQPIAAVVAIVALFAPILSAAAFAVGLTFVVRKAPPEAVPAFVAADAESPQAPRTLVLADRGTGLIQYSLLNGAGPLLGDAETGPPASAWQALDPYVAAVASGRGGDEIAALAGYGIRYVLLAPGSSRALVPTLDGEPGLRRLSSSGGEVLWRVAGVTSRARVVAGEKQTPVGLASAGTSTDPYLDQPLPDGAAGRSLVLGALADDGWRAVGADGTELAASAGPGLLSWSQAFTTPAGPQQVTASFDDGPRTRWLWFELLVLVVLVVLALPERRRLEDDDEVVSVDADGALPATPGSAEALVDAAVAAAVESEAAVQADSDDDAPAAAPSTGDGDR